MSCLWYDKPADIWEEALPVGNGRLGAMIYGRVINEEIQLNEETIWYGSSMERTNPDALKNLPEIRRLIFEGKILEAEKLAKRTLSGCPESMRPYQTAGALLIEFYGICNNVTDYRRELDLEKSCSFVSFEAGDTRYERKIFCSEANNAVVVKLTAEGSKKLSFDAVLRRERFFDKVTANNNDGITMCGNLGKGGSDFAVNVSAYSEDGKVEVIGERLSVNDASEAVLIISIQTTFRNPNQSTDDLSKLTYLNSQKAISEGENSLYMKHFDFYQSLYGRVSLDLGNLDFTAKPTDLMLGNISEDDGSFAKLCFDYGRYLLISCSQEGTYPANLQGIWNKDMTPPWDSKYTVNINMQMNYWPSEVCNLSECHMPLLEFIKVIAPRGRKVASDMYGCRGFVCHHNTDIYGDCAPQDIWIPGTYWVMGAAWLCTHIMTHYEYTNDIGFLKEYYPYMRESALFFVDFLVEKDGFYVTCPSCSPENTYRLPDGTEGCLCYGSAMDNQILRDLFTDCLKVEEILGINDSLSDDFRRILNKLIPTRTASDGSIMEWPEEYEEVEPGHRHISHLYGLFPSEQINMDDTPELTTAAARTLGKRLASGGGHTGWSRAWILNFYAQLRDGEACYDNLNLFFKQSLYPNLFDKHPPFQIDGNFGVTSAIANMLVKSYADRTVILPSLPSKWTKGSVKGLKLKGNGVINLSWEEGFLVSADITFSDDRTIDLIYGSHKITETFKKDVLKTITSSMFGF